MELASPVIVVEQVYIHVLALVKKVDVYLD